MTAAMNAQTGNGDLIIESFPATSQIKEFDLQIPIVRNKPLCVRNSLPKGISTTLLPKWKRQLPE
jgi:hypothetical protein